MKKILSLLVCLALLTCCLTFPTQAASPSLSLSCPEICAAGETVTVKVNAANLNNCCSAAFRITYDPALMEISSISGVGIPAGWQLVQNPYYSDNELFISLTGSTPATLSGTVATVSFTVKSTVSGAAAFSLTALSAVNSESALIPLTGGTASLTITPMEEALLKVFPVPGEAGQLRLRVDLSRASYYCALTFILRYDAARYAVADVQRGAEFSSATGYINPAYGPGEVFVSTLSSEPTCLNGELVTVTLTALDGDADAGDVTLEIVDYADSAYRSLDIRWQYDPVAVTPLVRSGGTVSLSANLANPSPSAQQCTVMAACYSAQGKMLGCTLTEQSIAAGECAAYDLSLADNKAAAYVQVFFLDSSGCPLVPAIRQNLPT